MLPGLPERITIGGVDYPNTLSEDVRINQGALIIDFTEHVEKMAYWATLYEMSLAEALALKNELSRAYAHADKSVRENAKMSSVRVTEKMVENSAITHPIYTEVQAEYEATKLRTGLLKAARDAMIHRRDMLIQLGATARAEGASDISIREQAVKAVVGT